MQLIPLKSQRFKSGTKLKEAFLRALSDAKEALKPGDILVIASKVVAYSQGLLKDVKSKEAFRKLVKSEADKVLDEGDMVLTMKEGILIPNAGIDSSNTPEGKVILWPQKPFQTAQKLWEDLKNEFKLSKGGILISDSHCQPLRQGTSGIALGWAGFEGVQDERGSKDLFGREMQYTQIAIADNLASAATLLMGETNASCPFVLVRGFKAKFIENPFKANDYFMPPEKCLYGPLYKF